MTHEETIKRIQELVPNVMELEFGCVIEKVFWYKSEADKKSGEIDWRQSSEHGKEGVIIKDLRSEFLPMTIDYGEQLEFQIEHNDIVSFEILGKPITLAVTIMAIHKSQSKIFGVATLSNQLSMKEHLNDTLLFLVKGWNLSKDNFNDQSEETKTFIGGLLTNK